MADKSSTSKASKRENFRQRRPEEWQNLLMERVENLFRYRMQHSSGQLSQIHLLKQTRREIAQLKTLIKEQGQGQKKEEQING